MKGSRLSVDAGSTGAAAADAAGRRRRSVHFGACPATVVAVVGQEDNESSAGASREGGLDLAGEEGEALALRGAAALRRQSAPASAIRGALGAGAALRSAEESLRLSHRLQALDPELRRSLKRLCATNLENPDEDLDVIRPGLLGRDEMELMKLKEMRQMRAAGVAINIRGCFAFRVQSASVSHLSFLSWASPALLILVCTQEASLLFIPSVKRVDLGKRLRRKRLTQSKSM